jgi:hypothetical protein
MPQGRIAAWRARQEADAAHRSLSELKVFIVLLPDDYRLELRAPMPDAADSAKRLGAHKHVKTPASEMAFARVAAGGWGSSATRVTSEQRAIAAVRNT